MTRPAWAPANMPDINQKQPDGSIVVVKGKAFEWKKWSTMSLPAVRECHCCYYLSEKGEAWAAASLLLVALDVLHIM